jgi:hypothetical protein
MSAREPMEECRAERGIRDIRGMELHHHIRRTLEQALGARSWNWLARTSGVAQSTLASQLSRPKFSVEVLWRVCLALDLEFGELLPTVPLTNNGDEAARASRLRELSALAARLADEFDDDPKVG